MTQWFPLPVEIITIHLRLQAKFTCCLITLVLVHFFVPCATVYGRHLLEYKYLHSLRRQRTEIDILKLLLLDRNYNRLPQRERK